LASPVTGGGITVTRFEQLFLLAQSQGKKQPGDWAQYAWQILASQGQKLVNAGKTLETPQENLEHLSGMANSFAATRLPLLKALQVA
jgi:Trk-type K+ transport system membrane component